MKVKFYLIRGHRNESYVPISFSVKNTGDVLVPNCDVIIKCPDGVDVIRDNEKLQFPKLIEANGIWVKNGNEIHLSVGDLKIERSRHFNPVYIKIPYTMFEVTLKWSLSSNTIKNEGVLKLNNQPDLENNISYVDDINKVGDDTIEDYIVDITDRGENEEVKS